MRQLLVLLVLVAVAACSGSATASPSIAPFGAALVAPSAATPTATPAAASSPSPALGPGTCLIVPQEYCDTAAVVTLNYTQPSARQAFEMDWVGLTVPAGTPIFAPAGGNSDMGALQPTYDAVGREIDLPLRGFPVGPTSSPTAVWILAVSRDLTSLPQFQVTSGAIIATASAAPLVGSYNLLVMYSSRSDANLHPDVSHLKAVFGLH